MFITSTFSWHTSVGTIWLDFCCQLDVAGYVGGYVTHNTAKVIKYPSY